MLLLCLLLNAMGKSFSQTINGSLPVVLVSFSVELAPDNKVNITWTTQQQVTTDIFTVEKSADGFVWNTIATIKSTGVSAKPVTYHSADQLPVKGINYYRVQIQSLDGTTGYTIIKSVRVNTNADLRVYPNPAVTTVTVAPGAAPRGNYWQIQIINQSGQTVLQKRYSSSTTICLPVNIYANGNYTLQVTDGSDKHYKTLMINHP